MATVDAVAANSMKPANFLDIGGGASTQSVLEAFRQIKEFSSVRAIIINIFAGITRCDEVARAIIAAKQQLPDLPPLFIRLAGTNYQEAAMLLRARNISTLATLEECLAKAKEVVDA
jgi:succinyl-CoA synthetase beta subunit